MSAPKKKDNATRYIAIGMVLFVLAVGTVFSLVSSKASSKVSIPASVSKADGYGIVLNPTAKVKVDFWEDFQCPNCRNFEAVAGSYLNGLITAGKIKAVFHPMTFIGPESILAANAAACTADAGKFLQMHELLYANQPSPENSGKWTNLVLSILAGSAGAKTDSVTKCITDGKYVNWTKSVEADAAKQNVNSTPTVFINGKQLDQTHYLNIAALKKDFAAVGVK